MAQGNIHAGRPEGANAVDELSRIVPDIERDTNSSEGLKAKGERK
jgi:hypothetical protein